MSQHLGLCRGRIQNSSTATVTGPRLRAGGSALLPVLLVLVAACGGGGSKLASTAGRSAPGGSGATVISSSSATFGLFLADAKGFVLYTATGDRVGGSGCTGTCLKAWPPLLLPPGATAPIAGPGVSGLGTFVRPEGTQVTYLGQPLYTYVKDAQPGQVTGQGVVDSGGTWFVATTSSPGSTAPTPTVPSSTSPVTVAPTTAPTVSSPRPSVTTIPPTTRPPTTVAPTTTPPTTAAPTTTVPGGGVSY
jgi:predicted lipoprotein with Yx(FWY)xxD motif